MAGAWIGPPRNHIREDIAVKAAKERVDLGVSNRAREAMELTGEDYDSQVYPQLKREHQQRQDDGLNGGGKAPTQENQNQLFPDGDE